MGFQVLGRKLIGYIIYPQRSQHAHGVVRFFSVFLAIQLEEVLFTVRFLFWLDKRMASKHQLVCLG